MQTLRQKLTEQLKRKGYIQNCPWFDGPNKAHLCQAVKGLAGTVIWAHQVTEHEWTFTEYVFCDDFTGTIPE